MFFNSFCYFVSVFQDHGIGAWGMPGCQETSTDVAPLWSLVICTVISKSITDDVSSGFLYA